MHSTVEINAEFSSQAQKPCWSSLEKRPNHAPEERPLLSGEKEGLHMPSWTRAIRDRSGRRLPQAIAHRGYKALHPENTMCAFKAAVKAQADALETDIHLSRDGVVVLSHDASLERCFGVKKKIIDCDWSEICRLRTLQEPHEPMPRLVDLLEYLAQPGLERIWVLLDIKTDNDADRAMKLIAQTLDSTSPSQRRSWKDRIVLGVWLAKFLPLCGRYLPTFHVSYIGFSTCYARKFLIVPQVSFNMFQKVLLGPIGSRFIRDVKEAGRQLFVWTVNEENIMKWSIQKDVDGVITDDVEKFKRVCEDWNDDGEPVHVRPAQWLYALWVHFVVLMFSFSFHYRFPETVQDCVTRRSPQGRPQRFELESK